MIPSHIIDRNRERFREEGRKARLSGLEIMDCPYTYADPIDRMLGCRLAYEWIKGWQEKDSRPPQ